VQPAGHPRPDVDADLRIPPTWRSRQAVAAAAQSTVATQTRYTISCDKCSFKLGADHLKATARPGDLAVYPQVVRTLSWAQSAHSLRGQHIGVMAPLTASQVDTKPSGQVGRQPRALGNMRGTATSCDFAVGHVSTAFTNIRSKLAAAGRHGGRPESEGSARAGSSELGNSARRWSIGSVAWNRLQPR